MTNTKIKIENLKCHGCANTITREVLKIEGVSKVEVLVEESLVDVGYNDSVLQKEIIIKKLAKLGYPEQGNNSLKLEVVSYVSCAIGRINK